MPRPTYPIWYRAVADYPQFGVWRGDLLRYDPTRSPELTVVRRLPPNHGGLLLAIEEGVFTPCDAEAGPVSLASRRVPHGRPPRQSPLPGRVVAALPRESA